MLDPLDLIERKESRGENVPNYKYGPGFSASGNFQIIDGTWRRWAKAAGIDISQYPTAMSAPYAVQRAVAAHGYKTEGFAPWEAVKDQVGREGEYGQPGLLSASGTPPSPAAQNRIDLSPYVAKGRTIEGSSDQLKERLGYALAAMPEDIRQTFLINSGYRTPEEQQRLWDASDKSGHMVARPGHSQHGIGNAFDVKSGPAQNWLHEHGKEYGLNFPMSYEPWHIETAEARGGDAFQAPWASAQPAGASTPTPPGQVAGILPPPPEPAGDFFSGLQSVLHPTETAPAPVAPIAPLAPTVPDTTQVQGAGDLMAGLLAHRRYGGFS